MGVFTAIFFSSLSDFREIEISKTRSVRQSSRNDFLLARLTVSDKRVIDTALERTNARHILDKHQVSVQLVTRRRQCKRTGNGDSRKRARYFSVMVILVSELAQIQKHSLSREATRGVVTIKTETSGTGTQLNSTENPNMHSVSSPGRISEFEIFLPSRKSATRGGVIEKKALGL